MYWGKVMWKDTGRIQPSTGQVMHGATRSWQAQGGPCSELLQRGRGVGLSRSTDPGQAHCFSLPVTAACKLNGRPNGANNTVIAPHSKNSLLGTSRSWWEPKLAMKEIQMLKKKEKGNLTSPVSWRQEMKTKIPWKSINRGEMWSKGYPEGKNTFDSRV